MKNDSTFHLESNPDKLKKQAKKQLDKVKENEKQQLNSGKKYVKINAKTWVLR